MQAVAAAAAFNTDACVALHKHAHVCARACAAGSVAVQQHCRQGRCRTSSSSKSSCSRKQQLAAASPTHLYSLAIASTSSCRNSMLRPSGSATWHSACTAPARPCRSAGRPPPPAPAAGLACRRRMMPSSPSWSPPPAAAAASAPAFCRASSKQPTHAAAVNACAAQQAPDHVASHCTCGRTQPPHLQLLLSIKNVLDKHALG